MMNRVIVLLLMVLLLVVSPLAGCSNSSSGASNLIALVPAKANMVGQADLSRILQDKDLTGIYDKVPKNASYPQTFNDAVNQLKDRYNIDLKSLQEVAVFADVSQSTGIGNYSGAIIKGTFNKNALIAAIQSFSGMEWSILNYKDYDIYSNETDDTAFSFMADNICVIGTMQSVKDVVDVKKGDAETLSGEVLDSYNKLGNALIKVALALPPGWVSGNLGQSASQILGNLSAFDKVKTVGITVSKDGESVTLNLKLCSADNDSAQSVENSINDLINFLRFVMRMSENQQQNQTIETLLNKMEVSRSDSCVNISVTATITEIEGLIQNSNQTA